MPAEVACCVMFRWCGPRSPFFACAEFVEIEEVEEAKKPRKAPAKKKAKRHDEDDDAGAAAAAAAAAGGAAADKPKKSRAKKKGDDEHAAAGGAKAKRAPPKPKSGDPAVFASSSDGAGGGASMERNADIAALIEQLADAQGSTQDANIWGVRALTKAAEAIRGATFPILNGKQAASCLAGVGRGTAGMIDEILATGRLAELDALSSIPRVAAMMQLQQVHGIGPKAAGELYDQHGITSLAQLAQRSDLLNDAQRIGLKYLRELEAKIPRAEMVQLEGAIKAAAAAVDPALTVEICGSYRRGRPESGDIDVLVTHPSYVVADPTKLDKAQQKKTDWLQRLVAELMSRGYIRDTLSSGAW